MRRKKFVFNQRTLQYEPLVKPVSFVLLRSFAVICAVVLTGMLFTAVVHQYFPSPGERALLQELEIARAENAALADEYGGLAEVVDHLHERSKQYGTSCSAYGARRRRCLYGG